MTRSFLLFQRRFGDLRPGMSLVAVEPAALPVTIVNAEVLAQERQPLPIIEQFVLRFVKAGVGSVAEVADLLGVGEDLVLDAAAMQVSSGNLSNSMSAAVALTPMGDETVRDLSSTRPVIKPIPVPFDRLTWGLADYQRSHLLQKKEAQAQGLLLLPPSQRSRINLDDVNAESLNRLLMSREGRERQVEILRVRKVSPNTHRYLPVQLLVYGDPTRRELELAVCIDDELSSAHTEALDAIDAVTKLGLNIEPTDDRPRLDNDLESQRVSVEEVERITTSSGAPDGAEQAAAVAELEVRAVSVFEHPDLLAQALDSARTRLMIIAPWVRHAVVNTDFLARLEGRLRAGVQVTIAHGYGKDDSGSDPRALERLGNLQRRFKDKFELSRLSDNHAKIMIFDDVWINTSFNWLSFRGDPDRTYRMEEGTLVRIPARVDEAYERYKAMIAELRIR